MVGLLLDILMGMEMSCRWHFLFLGYFDGNGYDVEITFILYSDEILVPKNG